MLKKWVGRLAVAAVAIGTMVGVSPDAPASASVCTTRNCGGVITNTQSKGIFVANNWCWSNKTRYYGNTLPCAPTWSDSSYQSYFLLLSGDSTADFYYFYDTDAFRVDAGCKVIMTDGGGYFAFDNLGGSQPMWAKISNVSKVRVANYFC